MTQVVEQKKDSQEWVDYKYDERIERVLVRGKRDLSAANYKLLDEYNDHLIVQTLSKALRARTMQTIYFNIRE